MHLIEIVHVNFYIHFFSMMGEVLDGHGEIYVK